MNKIACKTKYGVKRCKIVEYGNKRIKVQLLNEYGGFVESKIIKRDISDIIPWKDERT